MSILSQNTNIDRYRFGYLTTANNHPISSFLKHDLILIFSKSNQVITLLAWHTQTLTQKHDSFIRVYT